MSRTILNIRRSSKYHMMLSLAILGLLLHHKLAPAYSQHIDSIEFERGGLTYVAAAGVIEGRGLVYIGNNGIGAFDGGSWKQQKKYGPDELMEYGWIKMATSDNEGWAVSESCAVLHLLPKSEEYTKLELSCRLLDVGIDTDGTIWIAGEIGDSMATKKSLLLKRSKGSSAWLIKGDPPGNRILALQIGPDNRIWVSANIGTNIYGVYRSDPSQMNWSLELETAYPILDFALDRVGQIWAVGGSMSIGVQPSHQLIYVLGDGSFRSIVDEEAGQLRSIYFDSSNIGWAVGEWGVIKKSDAQSGRWVDVFQSNIGQYGLNAIVEHKGVIWFLGDTQFIQLRNGEFSYWGGEARPWGVDGIMSVSIPGSGLGWAVGWWGPVLHRENDVWVERYDVPHSLNAVRVFAVTDEDVWITYDRPGVLAHFDGIEWTELNVPSQLPIIDIVVDVNRHVWILVGTSGLETQPANSGSAIIEYENGKWLTRYQKRGVLMYNIDVFNSEVWAIGEELLIWDDEKFIENSLPAAAIAEGLVSSSITDNSSGWILSRSSVYFLREGRLRKVGSISVHTGTSLLKVAADNNNEAWIVGSAGLFHATQEGITQFEIGAARPSQIALSDVVLVRDDDRVEVWAVGRLETIVKITRYLDIPTTATATPSVSPEATPNATATSSTIMEVFLPIVAR